MEFVCRVGTPAGDVEERSFSAASEAALRSDLERQGLYVFSVRRGLGGFGGFDWRVGRPKVRQDRLMLFGQELAALLKAGLPLLQSLDVMLERQRDPLFRRSLSTVREKVRSGAALSDAFREEGELYPPIFSASLVAGERSGSLETVLRRFVSYLRLNQALRRKAISASVYPAALVVMMVALIAIMVLKVIPEFQSFYEGLGADLPAPTRAMMALADFVNANIAWLGLGGAAAVLAGAAWLNRPGAPAALDRVLLRLPFAGHMMRMYATSQLARTLSTLLGGGLPLLSALDVAAASVGNRAMAGAVTAVTPQIREGRSLTAALESTGLLEDVALEMIKVGEQTGALTDMLTAVADFYDEEVDTRLARAISLVEPVMLVILAVVVAATLLAFYLPMFQAISAIQGGIR